MRQRLTNQKAIEILRKEQKLIDCVIIEKLDLRELIDKNNDDLTYSLILENSEFEEIYATMLNFNYKFTLKDCIVDKFDVYATFFNNGFEITNNIFNKHVPFCDATHGLSGGQMNLSGNIFNNFVDFHDASFKSKIEIRNNNFIQGTNLLSQMHLAPEFTLDSLIEENEGNLKVTEDETENIWKNITTSNSN